MLDGQIRRWIDPPLDRLGIVLARLGLSANAVTVGGFLVGMGAWIALAFQSYITALILIVANRIADGLDGPLARRLGPTDLGGYLDIVLDFLFYAGVPFFFGLETSVDDRASWEKGDLLSRRLDGGSGNNCTLRADLLVPRIFRLVRLDFRWIVLAHHYHPDCNGCRNVSGSANDW